MPLSSVNRVTSSASSLCGNEPQFPITWISTVNHCHSRHCIFTERWLGHGYLQWCMLSTVTSAIALWMLISSGMTCHGFHEDIFRHVCHYTLFSFVPVSDMFFVELKLLGLDLELFNYTIGTLEVTWHCLFYYERMQVEIKSTVIIFTFIYRVF